ncbi:MAG: hypothetical protein GEV06_01710 [Luteitalea sp.]|nr:hypothetical protein [Luteitalea sp.]
MPGKIEGTSYYWRLRRVTRTALSIALGLLATGALASSRGNVATMPDPPAQSIQNGLWGGERVRLTVTADGATVEYDCGHGRIEQPISLDAQSRFEVSGWHVQEQGGALREGAADRKLAARYAGRVRNDHMTLTVELTESGTKLGTFSLEHGKAVRLVKCR